MIYFVYNTGTYNSALPNMGCEAKIGGNAGFNVAVNIVNPAYAGSKSSTILAGDEAYQTLDLGSGFYLKYKSGGLYAQVSGSGSATGTAAFGVGAAADATIGAAYTTGSGTKTAGFYFISSGSFSYTAPYFTTTGFTLNNMALDVTLTAVENFELSYSGYIGVKFNGQLSGNMNFATIGSSALTITITNFNTRERRSLQSGLPEYLPGEAVPLSLAYSSFPSSQTVVVFVSIVDGTSTSSYNSRQLEFLTTESGDGEFSFDWVVPWNKIYANKPLSFQVRTSNLMAAPVVSETFTATMFTETDGIFRRPTMNSAVPLDAPYVVEWQPELLHFFKTKRGSLFHGREANAANVTLSVSRDILAANGTLLRTLQYPLATTANTGAATLVLPSDGNFTKPVLNVPVGAVSRYFLTIQADEYSNIQSWSSGYISLSSAAGRQLGEGGLLAKPSLQQRVLLEEGSGLGGGAVDKGATEGGSTSRKRVLATCTGANSGSLTSSTYTGGGMTGITAIGTTYPVTSPTVAVALGSPSVSCMAVTAPPVAGAPTTASPTPVPTVATLLKLQFTIIGVSLAALTDSDKSNIRTYLAEVIGVSSSAISSFAVTDASTALARGAATAARALGSIAASDPDYGPDLTQHRRRLGAAVTVVAVVSVSSASVVSNQATVASNLVAKLVSSGSAALQSATSASLAVTVISPTAAPTLAPVKKSEGSSSDVAIGAGVGAGLGGALLIGLAGLWYYTEAQKSKEDKEGEGEEANGSRGDIDPPASAPPCVELNCLAGTVLAFCEPSSEGPAVAQSIVDDAGASTAAIASTSQADL